jgi:hypothetical protein
MATISVNHAVIDKMRRHIGTTRQRRSIIQATPSQRFTPDNQAEPTSPK